MTPKPLRLSGSQPFHPAGRSIFIMLGERTNVAGSPKFAKLIKEGKYEEAVSGSASAGRERRQRDRHLHG